MIIRNCAYLFIKHLCIFRRMQSWQQNFWSLKMIFSDFRIFFTWSTFRRAIRLWRRKNNCAHLLVYNDSKFHYEKLTFSFSYCNNTSILHEVCIFCRRSIVVVSYQEPSKEDRNSVLVREKITEVLSHPFFSWKQECRYFLIQLLEYIFHRLS